MPFIVKNTTIPSILDLLFPHSCRGCGQIGASLCNCCKNNIILTHKNICPNCKEFNPLGNCPKCKNLPPSFVVENRHSIIGSLIHDYKYNSNRSLAKPLAEILNSTLPIIDGLVTVVPLPTINQHVHKRGFDHTLKIAKFLSKLHKNFQTERVILRASNSVQVGANRSTRIKQAESAYILNPKITINPTKTYLLFDDVWTTGASMKNAVKILQKAGTKKIIIAILALS